MNKLLIAVVIAATLGAALWFGVLGRDGEAPAAASTEDEGERYDFEAQGVLLRQMDENGRLQYEVEAERILQMPRRGEVRATGLTLRHDPPGTTPGGPNRWILTAAEGELPAQGNVVTLSDKVVAEGTPQGHRAPMRLETNRLSIDLQSQEAFTDEVVQLTVGRSRASGKALRVNVATGVLELESDVHGTFSR